jgi:hypothetical protein
MLENRKEKENGKRGRSRLTKERKVADIEAPKKTTGPSTTKMAKPPASTARECEKNANFF